MTPWIKSSQYVKNLKSDLHPPPPACQRSKSAPSWEINTDQSLTEGQGLCQAGEGLAQQYHKFDQKKNWGRAAERTMERRGRVGERLIL